MKVEEVSPSRPEDIKMVRVSPSRMSVLLQGLHAYSDTV